MVHYTAGTYNNHILCFAVLPQPCYLPLGDTGRREAATSSQTAGSGLWYSKAMIALMHDKAQICTKLPKQHVSALQRWLVSVSTAICKNRPTQKCSFFQPHACYTAFKALATIGLTGGHRVSSKWTNLYKWPAGNIKVLSYIPTGLGNERSSDHFNRRSSLIFAHFRLPRSRLVYTSLHVER